MGHHSLVATWRYTRERCLHGERHENSLRPYFEHTNVAVESIVAKAIPDGALDATLDRATGWMVSKEIGDVYSTNEPQSAFKSRIAFCLNMHNEAVRALRLSPNSHKREK